MQTTTTATTPIIPADRQARRVRAVVAANARRKAEGLSDLDALFLAYDAGAADEHPADDGELVTEEWLRSAGFKEDSQDDRRWFKRGKVCVAPPRVETGNVWRWWLGYEHLDELPIRGHIRRLLAALGVESAK